MSFLLLKINLLLKFDFLLKYEAYPIKWTSHTWSFAGLYLPCGSFQRLRWSTAVWCRWRNLKPVHVIRKILWKTESVMIGKIVTFWTVKMQIQVIYGILLVNECCGTLGTAVNEAYFALFPMGAHVTGMTPEKSLTQISLCITLEWEMEKSKNGKRRQKLISASWFLSHNILGHSQGVYKIWRLWLL